MSDSKTTAVYYTVDGKTAQEWLARNTRNRRLRGRKVERMTRDMLAGNWEDNGETIKFYADDTLADGQHRLWALVEASKIKPDITIDFLVVMGLSKTALRTIDDVSVRSYADYKTLSSSDVAPGVSKINALANRVVNWYREEDGKPSPIRLTNNPFRDVLTHSEVDVWYDKNKELADLAIVQGRAIANKHKIYPAPAIFFCYLANELDQATAKDFVEKMVDWTNIGQPGHPILTLIQTLNRRLGNGSLTSDEELALLIMCWNILAKQDRWKTRYDFPRNWQTNEKFPAPVRPVWL